MTDFLPESELYPDLEDVLIDWLVETYPETLSEQQVDSETPTDLQQRFPFVQVAMLTGSDNQITDTSAVDVEVFAATRAEAHRLAEDIRQRLSRYPLRVGDVVIDSVFTEVKPRSLPWDIEGTRRFGATYQISARR